MTTHMNCLACKHEHLLSTGKCERCPCVWAKGSLADMEAKLPIVRPSAAELGCVRCGGHSQLESEHYEHGIYWGASLQREQDFHALEKILLEKRKEKEVEA